MGKPHVRTAPDGIVIIDKPAGVTSHDVVARMRRACGTRAIGHAGTLDPMATGVLVIGVERATKLLGHLMASTKRYDATIRLGVATNTEDAEGEVTATMSAAHITDDAIRAAAGALEGDIMQVPSAVSAIKVNGVRAYKRVRDGEDVQLEARPIRIDAFEVHGIRHEGDVVDVDVSVTCSPGTYIRALARDLGAALGVGAHLTALRRTASGHFTVGDAHPMPEQGATSPAITPLREVMDREFATVQLDAEEAALVRHGMQIRTTYTEPGLVGLLDIDGTVLALAEASRGHWTFNAVFSA